MVLESPSGPSRSDKPSYVGLSCAVNGYTHLNRYTSPDRRKTSPPSQIPVSSPPQTLDSVTLVLHQDTAMRNGQLNGHSLDTPDRAQVRRNITTISSSEVSSVSFKGTTREMSPLSDSGESTGSTSPGGNLVQKQIERLYGSKVRTVRVTTSPESGVSSSEEMKSPEKKTCGGFFSKRFGISRQKDRHPDNKYLEEKSRNGGTNHSSSSSSSSNTMDFKPLKVPAVFRLLRPEFREQLKSNSCQIPNEQTVPSPTKSPVRSPIKANDSNGKERVVPIETPKRGTTGERIITIESADTPKKASQERVIPIVRERRTFQELEGNSGGDQQPSTETRSQLPSPKPALPTKPTSSTNLPQISATSPVHSVKSPALVASCLNSKSSPEPVTPATVVVEQEEDLSQEAEKELLKEYEGVGGVHEIQELHTIMEEDNESSTSGSQINLTQQRRGQNGAGATDASAVPNSAALVASAQAQDLQEVHDGHYFIKLIENETFKFEEQICDFEEDATNTAIPEDIRESILAAVGKARLLMAQKLAQFRGLCEKNITQNVEEDPFVPTSQDLAGFWDMVYIQVEHIHSLFDELIKIRANGWRRLETKKTNGTGGEKSKPKRTPPTKSAGSKATSEAAKARNEARRKMMEEKKRQMKEKMESDKQSGNSDGIFVQF